MLFYTLFNLTNLQIFIKIAMGRKMFKYIVAYLIDGITA